jgi:hypothetical protein
VTDRALLVRPCKLSPTVTNWYMSRNLAPFACLPATKWGGLARHTVERSEKSHEAAPSMSTRPTGGIPSNKHAGRAV